MWDETCWVVVANKKGGYGPTLVALGVFTNKSEAIDFCRVQRYVTTEVSSGGYFMDDQDHDYEWKYQIVPAPFNPPIKPSEIAQSNKHPGYIDGAEIVESNAEISVAKKARRKRNKIHPEDRE